MPISRIETRREINHRRVVHARVINSSAPRNWTVGTRRAILSRPSPAKTRILKISSPVSTPSSLWCVLFLVFWSDVYFAVRRSTTIHVQSANCAILRHRCLYLTLPFTQTVTWKWQKVCTTIVMQLCSTFSSTPNKRSATKEE